MNQVELRTMAEERIQDAKVLLNGNRWAFAYYVAGYGVECALKACVLARMIHTGWVFGDKADTKDCRTHHFLTLIMISGLLDDLNNRLKANAAFAGNWAIIQDWKETSRYEPKTSVEAQALYDAITQDPDGVLQWIRNYW